MYEQEFIERTNKSLTTLEFKIDQLIAKQTEMNGSVKANTRWRYIMVGGLAVITALILPLLFLAAPFLLGG